MPFKVDTSITGELVSQKVQTQSESSVIFRGRRIKVPANIPSLGKKHLLALINFTKGEVPLLDPSRFRIETLGYDAAVNFMEEEHEGLINEKVLDAFQSAIQGQKDKLTTKLKKDLKAKRKTKSTPVRTPNEAKPTPVRTRGIGLPDKDLYNVYEKRPRTANPNEVRIAEPEPTKVQTQSENSVVFRGKRIEVPADIPSLGKNHLLALINYITTGEVPLLDPSRFRDDALGYDAAVNFMDEGEREGLIDENTLDAFQSAIQEQKDRLTTKLKKGRKAKREAKPTPVKTRGIGLPEKNLYDVYEKRPRTANPNEAKPTPVRTRGIGLPEKDLYDVYEKPPHTANPNEVRIAEPEPTKKENPGDCSLM